MNYSRHSKTAFWRLPIVILLAWGIGGAHPVYGQLLRVGPFDFNAKTKLEGIYTTNVEGERKSEATAERKDYYLLADLSLQSIADMSPSTKLSIDTGVAVEKHFVRDDLDNSQSPFGRLSLQSETALRHLRLSGNFRWERTSQSAEDVVLPGGKSRKTRNPRETMEYGAAADWKGGPFLAGAEYSATRDRYEKEAFKIGDSDEVAISYYVGWQIMRDLKAQYDLERRRTERVQDPDDDAQWKTTESVTLDWRVSLLKRPELTYSLGVEKEDTDEKKGKWELKHDLTASERLQLNPRTELTLQAKYSYEDNPEDDDISFTYSASFIQELTRTLRHQFSASREPAKTLGSTKETDTMKFDYSLTKKDLFIANLNLRAGVGYEITRPLDGPKENLLTYEMMLEHQVAISRRLTRRVAYEYSYEDSNLEPEILDEHRLSLGYEYTF